MADVFISYSRTDAGFVGELVGYLEGQERDVWLDKDDIAPADDWQQDIYNNIDDADSFVFVVSAKSLESEYCGKELVHAQQGGKRIIPIACDAADPDAAPTALAQLNWIWCREGDDQDAAFTKLTSALETDLAWSKAHTRLLVRAVEWDARGDGSLLLRGADLKEAEQTLAANAGKQPAPTELQQRYVLASRRAATRRQRMVLVSVAVALAVSLVLGIFALLQRNTANARARLARSQALVAQATQALSTTPRSALADAVRAVEVNANTRSEIALREALLANPIAYAIPAGAKSAATASTSDLPGELSFVDGGRLLAGLRPDGTLHLWRAVDGKPAVSPRRRIRAVAFGGSGGMLSTNGRAVWLDGLGRTQSIVRRLSRGSRALGVGFAGRRPLALVVRHGSGMVLRPAAGTVVRLHAPRISATEAQFSRSGNRVLTENPDIPQPRLDVWDASTGRLVASLPGGDAQAISPDGRFVATPEHGLWSLAPRRRLSDLGHPHRVLFSPDGRLVVAIDQNGSARLYQASTGALVDRLPSFGAVDTFGVAAGINFSTAFDPTVTATSDHLAVVGADGLIRVWERGTDRVVATVPAGYANALAFGPGGLLAAMTWDGEVVVARLPAARILSDGLISFQREFTPAFSRDLRRFVMPVGTGPVVADVNGSFAKRLPMPDNLPGEGLVAAWAISGDGRTAAVSAQGGAGCGNCIDPAYRSWTSVWREGSRRLHLRLPATSGPITLDEHGSVISFGGKAWRTATGAPIRSLDGIQELSPDGRMALLRNEGRLSLVHVGTDTPAVSLQGYARLHPMDILGTAFGRGDTRLLTLRGNDLQLWDAGTGRLIARLGRPGEGVNGFSFGPGGRLALVLFADRAATFAAATGEQMLSLPGSFDAISPAGTFAATIAHRGDGVVTIGDLATGVETPVQTDTALQLNSLAFGPNSSLVLTDLNGGVHLVRCTICASEGALFQRAKSELSHLPKLLAPPEAMTG